MKLKGAEILIETLIEQGVDTIFGYPGGAVLNIYDALYDRTTRIKHYITAHEQGAAHAADGYARATGKTGVVLATSGPGATNLVTGIANAYMDSVPMVAITGNVSKELIGRDSFQEVFITGITMPITKHNFLVRDVSQLSDIVRDAFRIANEGRPGPVLIDIPKDITAAEYNYEPSPNPPLKKFPFSEACLKRVAAMLAESKKPMIYFGGGVISSGASVQLREISEKADIPMCHSMMGTGGVAASHPLNLGMVGMHGKVAASKAVNECDLLIAIGARFSDRVATKTGRFAPNAKCVHIDIDPAEIGKNVSVEFDIIGDVAEVLNALYKEITYTKRESWVNTVMGWKAEFDGTPSNGDNTVRPWAVIDAVNKRISGREIIVTDVGQHQMWTAQHYKFRDPRSFITSGGLGTMGFGLGAAIGASVARPDKRVVLITGDGGFHMNLNELCTLVTYNIPVTVLIMNNSVLGMVRQWQALFYDSRYSSTTLDRQTDYVKLAEAFGATGYRISHPSEIDSVLDSALTCGGPCVIDCRIDRDEKVLPMIPSGRTVEDIIIE